MKNWITLFLMIFSVSMTNSQQAETRLSELGIIVPEMSEPLANYMKFRQVGNLIYLAGHVSSVKGKLGDDLDVKQGYDAARETGIHILSSLKAAIGNLDRVKQFVKVEGMVNCTDDFHDQSKVINGFSDLMYEVFGENGKHARVAVGHNSLPGNYAVEISAIVEIE